MAKAAFFSGTAMSANITSPYVKVGEVGPLAIKVDGLSAGTLQVQYKNDAGNPVSYASADSLFSADGETILTDGNVEVRLLGNASAAGTVYATISGPGVIKE